MSGVLQAMLAGAVPLPVAAIPVGTYGNTGGAPAVCNFIFNSDGTWTCSDDAGSSGTWLTQGRASDCEIFWSNTGSALTTGVSGAWLDMATSKTFGVTDGTVGAAGDKHSTGAVSIRRKSDLVVIAGPGNINLDAVAT